MADIFENPILCKRCNTRMQKAQLTKDHFLFRALVCPKCNYKIIHPLDEQEYYKFKNLKNKEFRVKMRIVGNSYTVSIPKEIVSFMKEQEKIMDDMVRLCFEDIGRLSLNFGDVGIFENRTFQGAGNSEHPKVRKQNERTF
jgi:DNA-directed RNA polymerase subunit M/transcription elongation factor TFIIS